MSSACSSPTAMPTSIAPGRASWSRSRSWRPASTPRISWILQPRTARRCAASCPIFRWYRSTADRSVHPVGRTGAGHEAFRRVGELQVELLHRREAAGHVLPVPQVPDGLEELRLIVLILQVIGVLPGV